LSPIMYFSFTDTPTPQIYTLSLHDALPISQGRRARERHMRPAIRRRDDLRPRLASTIQKTQNLSKRLEPPIHESSGRRCLPWMGDRKSTRLNSSHVAISYAVFCLKKKKNKK